MNAAFNALYLLLHLAGLVVVVARFRGTRAFFPGLSAFLMFACCYALQFVIPRDLGFVDRWPGAAWVDLGLCGALLGTLPDFCVLGLVLALAGPPGSGKPKAEIGVAVTLAAVGFLGFYAFTLLDHWSVFLCAMPLSAACYALVALAAFRRFRGTPLGLLVALGFLSEGIVIAIGFVVGMIVREPYPLFHLALRAVGLICWPLFLTYLATAPTRATSEVPAQTGASFFSSVKERSEFGWSVLLVFALYFWAVYELLTGGPVAAYFTWAKIPLPIVMLFFCWGGTVAWLVHVFEHAAPGVGPTHDKPASVEA